MATLAFHLHARKIERRSNRSVFVFLCFFFHSRFFRLRLEMLVNFAENDRGSDEDFSMLGSKVQWWCASVDPKDKETKWGCFNFLSTGDHIIGKIIHAFSFFSELFLVFCLIMAIPFSSFFSLFDYKKVHLSPISLGCTLTSLAFMTQAESRMDGSNTASGCPTRS